MRKCCYFLVLFVNMNSANGVEHPLYLADLEDYGVQQEIRSNVTKLNEYLPVVLMHGMGDAAHNSGMRRIQNVRCNGLITHTGLFL